MRIIRAAQFSFFAFAIAIFVTIFLARTGLRIAGVQLPRQAWLVEHTALWTASWWLWLLAIFSWMVLLTALMWAYLPGHRLNAMLQSGLMVIAATLTIGAIITWMNVLPWAAASADAATLLALADTLALALLGAGSFMIGAVTTWISIDLMRHEGLPTPLSLPGLAAGILFLPTPFLLPNPVSMGVGIASWLTWCLVLGLRRAMPSAFPEWK